MLLFSQLCFDAIKQDAINNYPDECCGFLLGFEENDERIVTNIICCINASDTKGKSFLISSQDYIQAEQFATDKSVSLLGIYHSHPDCAAVPSAADSKAALPYFSYLIVSVFHRAVSSAKSWRLTEISLFEEEEISINSNSFSNNKNEYGNYHHTYTSA